MSFTLRSWRHPAMLRGDVGNRQARSRLILQRMVRADA